MRLLSPALPRASMLPLGALLVVAAYSAVLVRLMSTTSYDFWGAAVFGPVLFVGSLPLLRRAAAGDDRLYRLLVLALALKLLASFLRYFVSGELYQGVGDANEYAKEGARLAETYRSGYFQADLGRQFLGTGATRMITGLLFTVIGSTKLGGYQIFSWLAFWGLVAFHHAFTTAVPHGDHRRYALLLFFLPSLLYWPSSIGKDALMLLGLGAAALGAARLLTRAAAPYLLLASGLGLTFIIRPHVAVLLSVGLVAAFVLRPKSARMPLLGPLAKPLGVLVLLLCSLFLIHGAESRFGVEEGGSATDVLDEAADRTAKGGSNFEAVNARSPAQVPAAVVAVLFRPFPWEANNAQALAASLEGLAILGLIGLSVRRFGALWALLRRNPYMVLIVVYGLLFCVAFSSFGNFGILTRQRIQLFPFVLTLVALPAATAVPHRLRVRN